MTMPSVRSVACALAALAFALCGCASKPAAAAKPAADNSRTLAKAPSAPASKPNIVHIVADDLGWKDVGFNGATDIRTPNLDALARNGAVLEKFYVQPMCTPTRAALMTGRYPYRYGLQTAVIPSVSSYGLDLSERLLPQVLKDGGYDTYMVGKWHLGHADQAQWPRQRGFDYHYGPLIGELDYFTHSEQGKVDWFRDNKVVREEGYTTTLLGKDADRIIRAQDPRRPFYLYLAFNAPHTPYQAPADVVAQFSAIQDPTRRTYAAMIWCLDQEIGRVVKALDDRGLRDNTLIIFHSDNGGTRNAMFAGVMADMSKVTIPCDNGPYREGKGTLYEGATRVCALANWPGHIAPGTVVGMMHAVDLFPTIANLAGASMEGCKPLDGMDVWATMSSNAASPRMEFAYNIEPFRGSVRDGDWKLVWRTLLPSQVELFNLAEDPSEKNNLAERYPDRVAAMQRAIEARARESAKPLFLVDQFKTVQKGMHGEPLLPTDEGFGTIESP